MRRPRFWQTGIGRLLAPVREAAVEIGKGMIDAAVDRGLEEIEARIDGVGDSVRGARARAQRRYVARKPRAKGKG